MIIYNGQASHCTYWRGNRVFNFNPFRLSTLSTPFYVENTSEETATISIGVVPESDFEYWVWDTVPIQKSLDKSSWTNAGTGRNGVYISIEPHKRVYLRATANAWGGKAYQEGDGGYYWAEGHISIQCNKPHNVGGNIFSLLYGEDFNSQTEFKNSGDMPFKELFYKDTNLIDAFDLLLPAETLKSSCYDLMFYGCTNLVSAPELPATTLADKCYYYMFYGCTNLVSAPSCLPATTLVASCYEDMFSQCINMIKSPDILATTLASRCCILMFDGCSNLNHIKVMFTTTPAVSYTAYWVRGVAASGTFIKNPAATWNVTGTEGVPSGWTIEYASN